MIEEWLCRILLIKLVQVWLARFLRPQKYVDARHCSQKGLRIGANYNEAQWEHRQRCCKLIEKINHSNTWAVRDSKAQTDWCISLLKNEFLRRSNLGYCQRALWDSSYSWLQRAYSSRNQNRMEGLGSPQEAATLIWNISGRSAYDSFLLHML